MEKALPKVPGRFYSLDVIRGFAALSVVFWHWQHFFYDGTVRTGFESASQPLYEIFFLFYDKGWVAVDFFFSLSGFIFFWLYAKDISARNISAGKFFVLRFSRLYPLHIATFLFVALAQVFMRETTGGYFVYPENNIYHAILNVFMASGWGMERGWSFNAPVWSVSIEVLLYAAFFAVCVFFRARLAVILALAIIGMLLLELHPPLGRGVFSFFVGGLVFRLYECIVKKNLVREIAWPLSAFVVTLWVGVILEHMTGWISATLSAVISVLPSGLHGLAGTVMKRLPLFIVISVVLPATILALALHETRRETLGRRVAFIGISATPRIFCISRCRSSLSR